MDDERANPDALRVARLRARDHDGPSKVTAEKLRRLVPPDPEAVKHLHRLADIGRKVYNANRGGRPSKAPPADRLLEEMRAEQEKGSRRMSDTEAAEIVAERHDLSAQHVMRLTKDLRK